jgi:hypothetical protein
MREEHDDLMVLEEGQSTDAVMACTCTMTVVKIK